MTAPPQGELRPPTYSEQVAIDTYKTVAGSALSDASAFGDKVVTAAVAVGTAYGAVIALVSPKDTPSDLKMVAPFIALAIALAFSLWAQRAGISITHSDDLDKIRTDIEDTLKAKRFRGGLGLAALVVGLVIAGTAVNDAYGGDDKDETKPATLWLSTPGEALVKTACGSSGDSLEGRVAGAEVLRAKYVVIKVDASACPEAAGTLVLPASAIRVSRLNTSTEPAK